MCVTPCGGKERGRAVSADQCDFFDKQNLQNCPEGCFGMVKALRKQGRQAQWVRIRHNRPGAWWFSEPSKTPWVRAFSKHAMQTAVLNTWFRRLAVRCFKVNYLGRRVFTWRRQNKALVSDNTKWPQCFQSVLMHWPKKCAEWDLFWILPLISKQQYGRQAITAHKWQKVKRIIAIWSFVILNRIAHHLTLTLHGLLSGRLQSAQPLQLKQWPSVRTQHREFTHSWLNSHTKSIQFKRKLSFWTKCHLQLSVWLVLINITHNPLLMLCHKNS